MRPYPTHTPKKNREGEKRQAGRSTSDPLSQGHKFQNTLGKVLLDGAAQEGCELQAEEFGLSGVEQEGALSRTKARVSQGCRDLVLGRTRPFPSFNQPRVIDLLCPWLFPDQVTLVLFWGSVYLVSGSVAHPFQLHSWYCNQGHRLSSLRLVPQHSGSGLRSVSLEQAFGEAPDPACLLF